MIDLDQDGLDDIVFCEAQDNEVRWIRQTALGSFAPEELLAGDLRGPVHVEGADMDADGDIDLVVSSMTIVFPHNDRIGFAFLLENDGTENFTTHTILENTSRIVDMRHAVGDGNAGKAAARTERIIPNTRDAVGDGDAGKIGAIIERINPNTRDAVGDGDAGHGGVPIAEDGRPTAPYLNDRNRIYHGWDVHRPAST
ncbi:MAG: VCBS repeat-containing protein [Opitutaceae bacterium]